MVEVGESDDLIDAHVAHLAWCNYRPSTIGQRGYALRRLERFMGGRPILEADHDVIVRFLERLKVATSKKAERSHVVGFFRWAQLEGLRDDDPTIRIRAPRTHAGVPHPMPEAQLAKAIAHAPDRVRPWLYLAAFGGLRAGEIAPLRADDLWWHCDPPLLVIREAKGGDEETVPISPVLAEELRKLPTRGYLFPRLDGKLGPLKPHNVSQIANTYLHKQRISLTIHSLRHRFGTQVFRASGRDLRQTQELLRHKSITSTIIYTAIDRTEAATIVGALPSMVAL